jgi:hypothetical protein
MAADASVPGMLLQRYISGNRNWARPACDQIEYDAPKVNQKDAQTIKPAFS